jgi:hypothetical protein
MKLAILGHNCKSDISSPQLHEMLINWFDQLIDIERAEVVHTIAQEGLGFAVADWARRKRLPYVLYMPENALLLKWDQWTKQKYFYLRRKAISFIHLERVEDQPLYLVGFRLGRIPSRHAVQTILKAIQTNGFLVAVRKNMFGSYEGNEIANDIEIVTSAGYSLAGLQKDIPGYYVDPFTTYPNPIIIKHEDDLPF